MSVRFLLPVLAVASLAFAVLQMEKADRRPPRATPPAEPARSPYVSTLAGVGLVEPETESITVGTPVSGVVKAVYVRVNDRVSAGGRLFELDDRHLAAELTVREAARDSATAQLARLDALPRKEEMAPLEARLAEAKANVAEKEKLYERAKRETASGVGSEETYDIRKAALDAARAQLSRAQAEFDLSAAGVWAHDRAVARAGLTQGHAQCDQARIELGRLRVDAPRVRRPDADRARYPIPDTDLVQFRVLRVNIRPGEFVGAAPGQPAVILGTVGPLHVRVDIDEADIPRFKPGAAGTASPRGNTGQKIPLRFVRVEPHVIAKRSLSGDSVERVDTRVLQVIFAIDATDHSLYVGQQLDVFLDAGGKDSGRIER